jgi:hypothetical protein
MRDDDYDDGFPPDAPRRGTIFHAWPSGLRSVERLIYHTDLDKAPVHFLVRAYDGEFWTITARDPAPDGIVFKGTQMVNA